MGSREERAAGTYSSCSLNWGEYLTLKDLDRLLESSALENGFPRALAGETVFLP